MEETIHYIGISITRDAIECHLAGQSYLALNQPEGHANFLARLTQISGEIQVICELSDGAETRLVETLHAWGFPVLLARAADVCASSGRHDASEIDGASLAKYGALAGARLRRPSAAVALRVPGLRPLAPGTTLRIPPQPPARSGFWRRLSKALARWHQTKREAKNAVGRAAKPGPEPWS